jgi:hypothetical protein
MGNPASILKNKKKMASKDPDSHHTKLLVSTHQVRLDDNRRVPLPAVNSPK